MIITAGSFLAAEALKKVSQHEFLSLNQILSFYIQMNQKTFHGKLKRNPFLMKKTSKIQQKFVNILMD